MTPSLARHRALSTPSPQMLTGVAALLGAALAMSISPTLVRLADVGPFASAFWRVALALPLLWAWMRGAETPASRAAAARFTLPTVLAGVSFAGDLFFWHLAAMHTTIANATFFATTAPIWVVVFGWLLLGQRVERGVLVGLALCIGGGGALVAQSFASNPGRLPGDVFGVVTGVFFGLYFLAVQAARRHASAARVTFELTLVTAVILGGVAFAFEPRILPSSPGGWLILATLAFVSHSAGQGLLSVALGRLPAAFSALVIFLDAIAAAVFAWIILGEPVSPVQGLGGLVIVAGIWIARPRERSAG